MNLKRAFDLAVAIPGLVIAAPVMLAAAAASAVATRSSPVFVQPRVGQHGHLFNIFKLKTLKGDVNPDDPFDHRGRETRIGNFLRRTRIDELPQLFNVLRGDMSLVGPRPQPEYESWARHPERIKMRPGLTGPAQIDALEFNDDSNLQCRTRRLEMDLAYAQTDHSLGEDYRLIMATLKLLGKKIITPKDPMARALE